MNDSKQEKLARHLLMIFREVWCEKDESKRIAFNYYHCEFQIEDGHCLVKEFMRYDHCAEAIQGRRGR